MITLAIQIKDFKFKFGFCSKRANDAEKVMAKNIEAKLLLPTVIIMASFLLYQGRKYCNGSLLKNCNHAYILENDPK
jgi:hypothetical protein